ncbi:sigma-70 family RNA polymerase sigma factor [Fulvivirgaceae bacterium BMA10]|uniref:Sigma-70 family RNA polymerase sigma factor n=1 Tax=Splendidivirga corallicola TaxID=3051826 RepID=A0ABT8KMJ9_9BACT|nr:sigma-70 family RNA polymerase sigma factor [Fulvivirgaceae bacterium BMA10]
MVALATCEQASKSREALFTELYEKTFPQVARYVSKMGGSFEEAKDTFQDALILYYEKTATGSAEPVVNDSAYLMGIVKHLWTKKFKANIKNTTLSGITDDIKLVITKEESPSPERLVKFLKVAGKKCLDILKAFYYDKQPMVEVADTFGFSSVRSATVQKYKCLEKVRDNVKQKSLAYEDFFE